MRVWDVSAGYLNRQSFLVEQLPLLEARYLGTSEGRIPLPRGVLLASAALSELVVFAGRVRPAAVRRP